MVFSADELLYSNKGNLYAVQNFYWTATNDFEKIEIRSVRSWLMEICHVSEYEMSICEAIAGHGKCLDRKIVKEINEEIVLPAGKPPMTQKELYQLNFRIHKRAYYHYHEAISGIR